ncbi:ACP phosphodiesterase [Glaciecola petra]|uniref:ACP phosphodiesterase n=1 Tax=Glaciecola petra TaxID=3075602 RepID=A0ABU2ZRF4_9ALTE|nr:ACP phosphodiesterase [Aestuariibacter sp. P117]MDT0594022.1 ACP phosphodiesterase [Aestuariibacter sp. P117]
MNYLAHICLAKMTETDLVGNFMGDFVKGSELDRFDTPIQHGIHLHRKIDVFTDQYYKETHISTHFPLHLRRTSYLCLDVYFDYLLIKHWEQFSNLPLNTLLDEFYDSLATFEQPLENRFDKVRQSLLSRRWLKSYASIDTIKNVLIHIENRFSRPLLFAVESVDIMHRNPQVERTFLTFFPLLIHHTQRQALSITSSNDSM